MNAAREPEAPSDPQRFLRESTSAAIVIGIPAFKRAQGIPHEISEATNIATWLTAYGRVPRQNLELIIPNIGTDGTVTPVRIRDIRAAFETLFEQRLPAARDFRAFHTRLTIVAIGPGFGDRYGKVTLQSPYDTEVDGQGLELTSAAEQFSRLFTEVVLIADVPRMIGHTGSSSSLELHAPDSDNDPAPIFYAFSNHYGSRTTEASSEIRFVPTLLAGLEGAAINPQGAISWGSLVGYALEQYSKAGVEDALTPEFRQRPGSDIIFRDSATTETTDNQTNSEDQGSVNETPSDKVRPDPEAPTSGIGASDPAARGPYGGRLKVDREAGDNELCLNVKDYAKAVAELYASAGEGEFCLAVFGPWGRGKTFLMRQVDRALSALSRGYRTITVSAWKYPSTPEAWVYLYEEFAKAAFEGPWHQVLPNVIRAGVVRYGQGPLLRAYGLLALGLIPLGTLFGFASRLVGILYPVVGVIGFILLIGLVKGVRNTKERLSQQYLSASRHTEKLGLQATIGSDLRALLMGWIPTRLFGGTFTVLYTIITAGLIAAVMLRLTQGPELKDLAKRFLGWSIVGGPAFAVEIGLVVVLVTLFVVIWYWLRNGGSMPRKILLVVDDLDRCRPEHLLSVMESIKLLIEEPDIRSRVQVAMLLEEDVLKHAIFEKYGYLMEEKRATVLGTHYNADQLFRENSEKLFAAHLRLPTLAQADVRELIETFSERRRNENQPDPTMRDTWSGTSLQSDPIGNGHVAMGGNQEVPQTKMDQDPHELEEDPQTERPPNPDSSATEHEPMAVSDRALEDGEIDAILMALEMQITTRPSLGPRAIRAFIFRYQLARLLLKALKTDWEPIVLARLLAQRAFGTQTTALAPISVNLPDEEKLRRVVDQVC